MPPPRLRAAFLGVDMQGKQRWDGRTKRTAYKSRKPRSSIPTNPASAPLNATHRSAAAVVQVQPYTPDAVLPVAVAAAVAGIEHTPDLDRGPAVPGPDDNHTLHAKTPPPAPNSTHSRSSIPKCVSPVPPHFQTFSTVPKVQSRTTRSTVSANRRWCDVRSRRRIGRMLARTLTRSIRASRSTCCADYRCRCRCRCRWRRTRFRLSRSSCGGVSASLGASERAGAKERLGKQGECRWDQLEDEWAKASAVA